MALDGVTVRTQELNVWPFTTSDGLKEPSLYGAARPATSLRTTTTIDVIKLQSAPVVETTPTTPAAKPRQGRVACSLPAIKLPLKSLLAIPQKVLAVVDAVVRSLVFAMCLSVRTLILAVLDHSDVAFGGVQPTVCGITLLAGASHCALVREKPSPLK